VRDYKPTQKIDFRCGFSKDFLKQGNLEQTVSQVWFKEGNLVEMDLHFGCSIFVFNDNGANQMD